MAINVDFSGVEGGRRNCPDGDYILEATSVEEKKSGEGNPYLAWKWKIAEGEYAGVVVYDNTSLQPQALWRLKGMLECLGVNVTGKLKLEPAKYLKRKLKASLVNETYQGKTRPRIAEFLGPAVDNKQVSHPVFVKGANVVVKEGEEQYKGTVLSSTPDMVVVSVTSIAGGEEEWEVSPDDLELANT